MQRPHQLTAPARRRQLEVQISPRILHATGPYNSPSDDLGNSALTSAIAGPKAAATRNTRP